MSIAEIIIVSAQLVGVSPDLMLSVCWQETHHRNMVNRHDKGSPSFGVCQVKKAAAKTVIPTITEKELMNPLVNAYVAAKYIKQHQLKYKSEKIAISRYNGGYKNKKIVNKKYVNSVLSHKKNKPWRQQTCSYLTVKR